MRLVGIMHKDRYLEEIGIITRLPYVSENDNFSCSMKLYWVPKNGLNISSLHDIHEFFFSLTNFISFANFNK
jgi:hypothetical protein